MSLSKTAVDSVAEKYWTDYFSETGYGKLWVKKIPMRVRAALAQGLTKTASTDVKSVSTEVKAIAGVVTDTGVTVEGVCKTAGDESYAFVADFTHDGELTGFNSVALEKTAMDYDFEKSVGTPQDDLTVLLETLTPEEKMYMSYYKKGIYQDLPRNDGLAKALKDKKLITLLRDRNRYVAVCTILGEQLAKNL